MVVEQWEDFSGCPRNGLFSCFGVSFGPGFLLRGRNEDSKCKLVCERHEGDGMSGPFFN